MTFRNYDRELNKRRYPFLYYPYVYVIHGGYRDFYQKYGSTWCDGGYTLMLDETYSTDGTLARAKQEFTTAFEEFNMKVRGSCPQPRSRLRESLHSPKKGRFYTMNSPIRRSMCARVSPQFMMACNDTTGNEFHTLVM